MKVMWMKCNQVKCLFHTQMPEMCPTCESCGADAHDINDECDQCWNCLRDEGVIRRGTPTGAVLVQAYPGIKIKVKK